jgi:hypothetical protein
VSWATCGEVFCACLALIAVGLWADERRCRRRDISAKRANDCKPGAFMTHPFTGDWK